MNTEDCILTRRSIRKFKNVTVELDKIGKIIEAGRAAPSAGNLQNWMFIIVDDEGKRKAIAEACFKQYWIANAPVHIVICSQPLDAQRYYGIRGERLYSVQNCAAAAENMLLMAHDQGLGACWVGAFDEEKIKGILSIVKEIRPQIIIPIGYADEDPGIPSKLKLDNVAYLNGFRRRIRNYDEYFEYSVSKNIQDLIKVGKTALEKARKKVEK